MMRSWGRGGWLMGMGWRGRDLGNWRGLLKVVGVWDMGEMRFLVGIM